MKTLKESLLVNAHLFIMFATLALTCGVFGLKTAHSAPDDTHMAYISYGYEPVSAQYALAMAAGERVVAPQELQQNIDGDRRPLTGMQYAAEASLDVFDPYGLRSGQAEKSKHGQVLASVQYAAEASLDVFDPYGLRSGQAEKSTYGQVWVSMQYAAEAGEAVFDPYGLQSTQLSASRQKIEKLTPLS